MWSYQHVHGSSDIQGIAQGQAHIPRVCGFSGQHCEQGGKEDDEVANGLQPHGEPPAGHKGGVIAHLIQIHFFLTLLDELIHSVECSDCRCSTNGFTKMTVDW